MAPVNPNPAQPTPAAVPVPAPGLSPPQQLGTPSAMFVGPMPAMATSSYDQLERQFYGRNTLPTQRLFTPGVD
jgi:hypothetical protein